MNMNIWRSYQINDDVDDRRSSEKKASQIHDLCDTGVLADLELPRFDFPVQIR